MQAQPQAVARVSEQAIQPAEAVSEATAIIMMIERAASNKDVDIDKMERLLQMQERVIERRARTEYSAALAELQPLLPVVAERGVISTDKGRTVQSRYALWEDVNEAIRPHLAACGFALSFRTGRDQTGLITVTGVLSHRGGHSEETTLALPVDASGSKNSVQGVGSSLSYGKRYTAYALLNITTFGDDDDGQRAGAAATVTEDQVGKLQELIESTGADKGRFLQFIGAPSLSEIPAKDFTKAMQSLLAKAGKK